MDRETINFCDIEAALDSCACGSDFKFTSSGKLSVGNIGAQLSFSSSE